MERSQARRTQVAVQHLTVRSQHASADDLCNIMWFDTCFTFRVKNAVTGHVIGMTYYMSHKKDYTDTIWYWWSCTYIRAATINYHHYLDEELFFCRPSTLAPFPDASVFVHPGWRYNDPRCREGQIYARKTTAPGPTQTNLRKYFS